MTSERHVTPVASGLPYVVVSVNHRAPESLDDLLVGSLTMVEVACGAEVVMFQGPARRDADSVLIYEKDNAGIGKDVRIWRVSLLDGRFEAVARPTY